MTGKLGPDIGISTPDQFAQHILNTMMDLETQCFTTQHGHEIYYNRNTNTMVTIDLQGKDLGTCFRPTGRERKFQREFEKDVRHGGKSDSRRIRGGYADLQRHQKREQSRNRDGGRERVRGREERGR